MVTNYHRQDLSTVLRIIHKKIQVNIIFFASKIFSAPADLSYPLFLTLFHDNTALNLIR